VELGGRGLIKRGGLMQLLNELYPNVEWQPWKFELLGNTNFFSDSFKMRRCFDFVAHKMNAKNWEDWYKISPEDIERQ
jgi:hypothetical protein